mgnify:CR=1 FL=1
MEKFSILLVDDVPENIYSLKMMIEDSFDVNIFSALSAQEGMEILMKENIDLILTDVQMPEIDGFEFVEYLKNIEKTKNIPVIFITGIYDKDEYKTKGYNLGAIEYITKPIHDILLNSKLKVYIDIFEKKKLDEELIASKDKVLIHQSKMATMGEMIGVIAHQLKQPLNVLSLYCNDVRDSFFSNEINDKFIDDFSKNTKEQINFLSETIDDFRDFFNPNKHKMVFEIKDRSAQFHCTLVMAAPNRESLVVEADWDGYIGMERRGENGFGYDPLFLVGETGKTAAELSLEEKNQISHRAQALEKLVEAFPVWQEQAKQS